MRPDASRERAASDAGRPWVRIVEQWIAWEGRVHSMPFYPEIEAALVLRDRLAIALGLLVGLRGAELLPLEMQDVDLGATAHASCLTIRQGQWPRIQPRTIPVGDVPGLAQMLRFYVVNARPVLRQPGRPQASTLLLSAVGTRVIDKTFSSHYAVLRAEIFPDRVVTLYGLRRASLALHSEGLRVPLSSLAAVFGVSVGALTYLRRVAQPSEGWARALGRRERPSEIDRLLSRLRTWLDRLTTDFTT